MAEVTINLQTGEFAAAKKGDFWTGMYENSRGAQKQFTWLTSLVAVAAEFFDKIKDSALHVFTEKLKTATLLAAPLAAMPEAVLYGIKSVRAYADMMADCTMKSVQKAFGNTVKAAQRLFESSTALMKLDVFDAANLVAAKFFKDSFACVCDLLVIDEAFSSAAKTAKCADERLKKAKETEDTFVYAKGVVGFTFHAMNVAGLLCAGAVTFHMVTGLASLYTFTVLGAAWFGIEREDIEKDYALEMAEGRMVGFDRR